MGDEAVAIIGIGCRFPGADDSDEFWRLLRNGENHVLEIPLDRFNISPYYDEDKEKVGKTYNKTAGLVNDYDNVDSSLYSIGETEASTMDPQQSLVLDCTHMALEDAGIPPSSLRGSSTGVYIGCMYTDYKSGAVMDLTDISSYSLTGNTGSAIASRVAYTYSLKGPAMIVDTACSAALVALHTAARAIAAGDCMWLTTGILTDLLSSIKLSRV